MKRLLLFLVLLCSLSVPVRAAKIVNTKKQKYNYKEYTHDIRQLQKKYPDILHYEVIGTSVDQRKIYDIVLGNPAAKKHMMVISNLHAREYMTTQLSMAQIEYLCRNYHKKIGKEKVKKTLSKVAIHFIPAANPDGTAISQYGFHVIRNVKWRKRLRKMPGSSKTWKSNGRGVDLNRNWSIAWKRAGRRSSAGYRGPKAESEPEVKAILRQMKNIEKQGKIIGIVNYHSMGSIIYGRCARQAKGKVKRQTRKMYKLAQKLTGYHLMPTQQIVNSRGCSREYFLYKRNIPSITLEIGTSASPVPVSQFPSVWRKNKNIPIREAQILY